MIGRMKAIIKYVLNLKAGYSGHIPGLSLQVDVPVIQLMSDDISLYFQATWLRKVKVFFFF